jgi:SOS-response transcriptional repressor LexA
MKNDGLGARVGALRKQRGLTFQALSRETGSAPGFLHDIETGKKMPGGEIVLALARALGVSTDYLLTGKEPTARLEPSELPQPVVFFASAVEPPPADLVQRRDFIAVPLVDGAVAAGSARVVSEQVEDWAWIHQSQLGHRHNLVAVRVRGDSMDPVLPDGSMVVVDREDRDVVDGAPYVVRVDDEGACTVKYLEADGEELVLIPENHRAHREQRVRRDPDGPDIVVGRVVWSWRVWISADELGGDAAPERVERKKRAGKIRKA